MNFDFLHFFFELIILWLPLSLAILICEMMDIRWGYIIIALFLVYVLVVILNRMNKYTSHFFHYEKRKGNEFLESIWFLGATLFSALMVIKWIDNVVEGIILIIFLGIFFSSWVIKERPKD